MKKYRFLIFGCPFILLSCISCGSRGKDTGRPLVSNEDTAAIHALLKKSASFKQTNPDSQHHYAMQALEASKASQYLNGIASANALEVSYLRKKGMYAKAVDLNLEVIKCFDSIGNDAELANNLNILADIYKELGGEKKTIEHLEKGVELTREAERVSLKISNYVELAYSLNERGIIFRGMSEINNRSDLMDSAFLLFQQAIQIAADHPEAAETLPKLYNNISQVYNEHYHNYPKALEYLQKAVAINSVNNKTNSLSFNYGNISEVYMNMGDLAKARDYALKTLAISSLLNAPHRMQNAYSQLTRVNKALGRYDSALFYKEKFIEINDSLTNLDRSKQIADAQTKYETAEKESRITLLSSNIRLKNRQFYGALAGAVLLAAMIGMMWSQNRKLARQKSRIAEQSERLQWMMKELHHRVKNNLQIVSSLLNLQSNRLRDEESATALKESQLRVQAMSLLHQRLYQVEDVSMVNFRSYINDLVETLMRSYGYETDDFDLRIRIEEEFMDVDTAMPMGLLVNEIITNSFKYAYPHTQRPLLSIDMHASGDKLDLSIRDNGPGIRMNGTVTPGGFGKKLIDALSKQLKAKYTVHNEEGAVYKFQLPFKKVKAA